MRIFNPPQRPGSIDETGLEQALVEDLVLKHLLILGEFRMADVAERVKLPASIVETVLEGCRRESLIEVKGAANYTKASYLFRLTDSGRRKGQEILKSCRYVGPAPVSLDDYREVVQKQTVQGALEGEEVLRKALSHLVISETVLGRLGPAMISGQAVFMYGPSGNGKTSIAEAIGQALPEEIYLPYAVTVHGQIINVFDPVCHRAVASARAEKDCDDRWVLIKRPVVNAGGELSLRMLDVNYNPATRYYEASLQMKANNGLFILDDFGRQQVDPVTILNRWLTPLERRVDHLALQNGMKFVTPFDVLVIFSTDLEPKDLLHEAFLRRMRYKIRIDRPTEEEYLEIFKNICRSNGMEFDPEVYKYLEDQWYGARGIARSACHPRDLLDLVVARSRYYAKPAQLTLENISAACPDYFVTM